MRLRRRRRERRPTDPPEVLQTVVRALGDVGEGRPIDFVSLRAAVVACGDQLDAMACDERIDEEGQSVSAYLATSNAVLTDVLDALEAGDIDAARHGVRRYFWAPTGQEPAPWDAPL